MSTSTSTRLYSLLGGDENGTKADTR